MSIKVIGVQYAYNFSGSHFNPFVHSIVHSLVRFASPFQTTVELPFVTPYNIKCIICRVSIDNNVLNIFAGL
jgi:hypothetical protein